ncbi:diacylglycerol kinase [Streptomyces sp. RB6PN25]|uniref:Diacylglycerol kinase n=1 Tax=Streptomyces humicola TaxID=2953240 RepID=A0ABT1PVF6_9ACTN|nr:diacylglycerol kinase [Streptomyces humicola]MCQ4081646.1 diacylglycerol kinase [Streptomyces humicola]
MVIDPLARTMDGESVRIAKDVLQAGAPSLKICLPESHEELERALAHRGRRRPVVVGDDRALLRTVRILHRERALDEAVLSLVPVGQRPALALARALGVPLSTVSAARAVLGGTERSLDLLVDDSGGIVVGALRIPGSPGEAGDGGCAEACGRAEGRWLERGARNLVRALTAPLPSLPLPLPLPLLGRPGPGGPGAANGDGAGHRLRVEADGVVLADLDRPVHEVSVRSTAGGLAEVFVRHPESRGPLRVRARVLTVSGRDFRYRADESDAGPVRRRTWTVQPRAWRLTVPR